MESQARAFTALFGVLHKNGIVEKKYVVPRSRLESSFRRDGHRRIEDLANRCPEGLHYYESFFS